MLEGVFSALITPFANGRLDKKAFARLIDHQIEGGVNGIVPCGTTGESATLTHAEHEEVIAECVRLVNGRVPVVAGTGSNATAETIRLTRFAKEAGADAALVITPYYNKPTQEGLFQHFQAVSQAVELPLVLYNVPGRTAVDMQPDTVARAAGLSNVVAIKDATADMQRASEIRVRCGSGLTLLSGDDLTFLPFMAVGGRGAISVTANIAPEPMARLWTSWNQGDLATALEIHESLLTLNGLLFCETNPIPVKAAAHMMGLCGPELRLPLTPLSAGCAQRLKEAMVALGLLQE